MMVHLTAVDEETENETTITEAQNLGADDEAGRHEEKVRVDRRKLEQMLQANGDENSETAEGFFTKVMHVTDTQIHWPSKLKIGAKSKKDPHIKIAGQPESIKKAKDMVVEKLESKANRVTLKMDVSHTDHSHIIGRRGQSINKVMDETNCHIHFPDSNRGSANADKSNQVSISGQPEGVERARARIRELLPLVLLFEIPYDNVFLPFDPMTPTIQNIAQNYDVTFTPKGRTQMGYVIAVRGNQERVANIQEAVACLIKQVSGSTQAPNIVQCNFDVAPQHHVFLVGRSGCNIREIMEVTGAKIELPDPRLSTRNGTITVSGSMAAVVQARKQLLSLLPLLLMFDLKEDEGRSLQDQPDRLKHLMDKFGVTISIKPKPKQLSKSVTVKSKESNAQNMYLTRLEILGSPMDPLIPHNFPPSPFFFNHTPWYANFMHNSPITSPLASPTFPPMRSESPLPYPRRTPSPGSRPPPGFDIWRPHSRSVSFNNGDYHKRLSPGETEFTKVPRTSTSEGGSPQESFDFSSERRKSDPPAIVDPWSPSSVATQKRGNSSPSLLSTSKQRFSLLEGTKNPGAHGLLDSHGSNPASSRDSSLASVSLNFDRVLDHVPQNPFIDYEKHKGIASRLMTMKVVHPQVRVPTGQWSGMHLSKSSNSSDFDALKKQSERTVAKPSSPLSSSKEGRTADIDLTARCDPMSASMHVSRERKAFDSPFPSKPGGQFTDGTGSQMPGVHNYNEIPQGLDGLLKLIGVEDFAERFRTLKIDLDVFLTLTKDDLKEAGVEPLGVRKKMENAIEEMKKLKEKAVREAYSNRAQNYRVRNPLEFSCRSGRF